jgi:hypothetical protein
MVSTTDEQRRGYVLRLFAAIVSRDGCENLNKGKRWQGGNEHYALEPMEKVCRGVGVSGYVVSSLRMLLASSTDVILSTMRSVCV